MNRDAVGGNAFPNEDYHGMTLRDYFAAKAMQSIMLMDPMDIVETYGDDSISRASYIQADRMLAEREKQ